MDVACGCIENTDQAKAYDHEVIDKTARSIVETAERTGALYSARPADHEEQQVYGDPGSFKDKDSREHFQLNTQAPHRHPAAHAAHRGIVAAAGTCRRA